MKQHNLLPEVQSALLEALQCFRTLGASGAEVISHQGVFGDLENDTEIKADTLLGEVFCKYFLTRSRLPIVRVTIEGADDIRLAPEDEAGYWITIDPLDGSLNYAARGAFLGLPVTSVVTVLEVGMTPQVTFSDVVAAGVIDLRSGDMLIASREELRCFAGSEMVSVPMIYPDPSTLDIGRQIVFAEGYYPEMREHARQIFDGQKGWVRNPGSAGYEMMLVGYGSAVAYLCDRQKQHELGAGYLFMKARNGIAIDWDGNDLGSQPYVFNAQTPCILAVTSEIGEELLKRIQG